MDTKMSAGAKTVKRTDVELKMVRLTEYYMTSYINDFLRLVAIPTSSSSRNSSLVAIMRV